MPAGALEQPLIARRTHSVNHVARHADQQPDAVALRFLGRTITWRELDQRVHTLASAMYRRGIRAGDRVLILMTNRPEFLEGWLAANALGAIAVPVNFRLTIEEIGYVAAHSGATAVLTDATLAPVVTELQARQPDLGSVLVAGSSLEDAIAEVGEPHPPVDVAEDSPALIMYTSGTTGRPKGAVLSHLNLQMQAFTIIKAYRLYGDDDLSLVAAPLFHIAGIGAVGPNFFLGIPTVLLPTGNFDPVALLDVLEAEGATTLFLVPTQWQAMCAVPGVEHRKLRLRSTSWGAAPASETLLRRMAEVFPGAVNVAVFGQTEMSPVTCVLPGEDAIRKIGSVGKPISTVSVRIVDDEMHDVPEGAVGEIVYRGPTMMAGYWNDPEATAEAFAGGWFHSGDLVRRDDEGFLYVVDRKKDMLISGGENIYCAEVENVLAAHPAIVEVAVIGRPDPTWGEAPVAVVVISGAAPTPAELSEWLRDQLARYKHPKHVVVVDALPRNASGKVIKAALREQYS